MEVEHPLCRLYVSRLIDLVLLVKFPNLSMYIPLVSNSRGAVLIGFLTTKTKKMRRDMLSPSEAGKEIEIIASIFCGRRLASNELLCIATSRHILTCTT